MSDKNDPILAEALRLCREGLAVHWLRSRSKAPTEAEWSQAAVHTVKSLRESYRKGYNVGVRLGEYSQVAGQYVHVIDLDIRNDALADQATDALRGIVGSFDDFGVVISGSGGKSRHLYFLTDRPFRSKKLAHSDVKFLGADGKKHWAWEIELFGTGKQVAAPSSIHPDTGKRYIWRRETDAADWRSYEAETVAKWLGRSAAEDEPSDGADLDDLDYLIGRLDWPHKKLRRVLDALDSDDFCEDRDGWLQVGMALHHETGGSADGLELWHEFSSASGKYDAEYLDARWPGFGRNGGVPVRFVTLVKAAGCLEMLVDRDETDPDEPDTEEDIEDGLETTKTKWTTLLDVTDEGVIKSTLYNISVILQNDPRFAGVMRENSFVGEIYYRGKPGLYVSPKKKIRDRCIQLDDQIWRYRDEINGVLWTDSHDNAIRMVFETPRNRGGYSMKVTDRDLASAIDIVARKNPYHPVREAIESVAWDGVRRIDTLALDYIGAPDTPYHRLTGRLMLIATVARVYEPGHKFDYSVILEGTQGCRKSTFIEALGMAWAGEFTCGFDSAQKTVETLQGKLVLELPELSQFGRGEVESIKAFFSSRSENVRLAYARRAREYPRQSVYWGSTNLKAYLKDPTGNRRFWPWHVNVPLIDTDSLREAVPQLYAEALVEYRDMRRRQPHGMLPLYLADKEAQAEALRLQGDAKIETDEDAVASSLGVWLDKFIPAAELQADKVAEFDDLDLDIEGDDDLVRRDRICALEVWTEFFGQREVDYLRGNQLKMGRMLDSLVRETGVWEFIGGRIHRHFGRQRVYQRIDSSGEAYTRASEILDDVESALPKKFSDIL